MVRWGVLVVICVTFIFVDARFHQKRDTKSQVCDPFYINTNKIHCFCKRDSLKRESVRSAECSVAVDGMAIDDDDWNSFDQLENVDDLSFRNSKSITLTYIPTTALKHTKALVKLDLKYAHIEIIDAFAFANLTLLREITVADNYIKTLKPNAFAHHKELVSIVLDMNKIEEINRDVFVDLPSLEKIYLAHNKITTIHDRAFVHLVNLRDLELDSNNLFSLNSETFAGLTKLEKLDISSNDLEVIGDNTFLPLKSLLSLNLEGNRIQMLDGKAFNGLGKVRSMSLAHNNLSDVDNVEIFKDLKSLTLLSLKGNQLRTLKSQVMAPIVHNFYSNISSLNIDGNNFDCDCRLDWFVSLMNKTDSPHMKLAVENMKCTPSNEQRDKWTKATENDKRDEIEDGQDSELSGEYEYYDDTQLNGKLFYIDIRFLLNCSEEKPNIASTHRPPTTLVKQTTEDVKELSESTHKPDLTSHKIINQGLLDLEKDTKTIDSKEKQSSYTTSRLATVSANPVENFENREITKLDNRKSAKSIDNNNDSRDMASDEAKPNEMKAHRFQQIKDNMDYSSDAIKNVASIYLHVILLVKLL